MSEAGNLRMMSRAARLAPYWWLMRLTFLKLMAYRMRYVTGIATYAIFVGGQFAIWQAIFAAKELTAEQTLDGLTLSQMATYLAIGYMARAAYFTNTDSEIAARFQSGDVTLDLLKPLSFHGQWLAQAAGETGFRLLFFAAPMSLILVPLFGVQAPTGDGWWQFPVLFVSIRTYPPDQKKPFKSGNENSILFIRVLGLQLLALQNICTNSPTPISGKPSLRISSGVISFTISAFIFMIFIGVIFTTFSPFFKPWHFSTAITRSPAFRKSQPKRLVTVFSRAYICGVVSENDIFLIV